MTTAASRRSRYQNAAKNLALTLATLAILACGCVLAPRATLWYLAFLSVGMAAWPLAFRVCSRLPDAGWCVARTLGPLLVTYVSWVAGFTTLGFSRTSIALAALLLVLMALSRWHRERRILASVLGDRFSRIVLVEFVAVIAFTAMVLLRATTPYISVQESPLGSAGVHDAAAEKFTDFTILHGLMQAPAFPPEDTWLAHRPLNYYYFGHLVWATAGKALGTPGGVAYNLGLAMGFCLACIGAAGAAMALGAGKRRAALLGVFLVCLAGNLDSFLQAASLLLDRIFLQSAAALQAAPWWQAYDFWRPSRAVENTITEFPAFSYLLGDLHAHLNALPLLLLGVQLVVQMWHSAGEYGTLMRYEKSRLNELLTMALVLGALSASNTWDSLTLTMLLSLAFWTARSKPRLVELVESSLLAGVLLLVGSRLLFLPFARQFQAPLPPFQVQWSALQVVSSPIGEVGVNYRSGVGELFAHWGLLAPVPLWCIWRAACSRTATDTRARLILVTLVAAAITLPFAQSLGAVILPLAAVALIVIVSSTRLPDSVRLGATILAACAALVGLTEWVYIDDIFDIPIHRINTVFKVWYGVWVLLAVLCAGMCVRFVRGRVAVVGFCLLLLVQSAYPVLGLSSRLRSFTTQAWVGGIDSALDGTRYLRETRPGDWAAAQWLMKYSPPRAALLEATGTQYTLGGRMGTLTGRPSYGGWLMHEYGWRGPRFTAEQEARASTARDIYVTSDVLTAQRLLMDAQVDYVVLGDVERRAYPELSDAKFGELADVVLQTSETMLYRIRPFGQANN